MISRLARSLTLDAVDWANFSIISFFFINNVENCHLEVSFCGKMLWIKKNGYKFVASFWPCVAMKSSLRPKESS